MTFEINYTFEIMAKSARVTQIWANLAWWNQAITWNNVDLSSVSPCDSPLGGNLTRDTSSISR